MQLAGIPGASAASFRAVDGQPDHAGLRNATDLLLERLLYGADVAGLAELIVRDLSRRSADDPSALLMRAIALTLGSAQFQRY